MSTPRSRLLAAIGVFAALSIGCGDGPTEPPPAVPGSITAASATTLNGTVGQPVPMLPSVIVRSQHGDLMFGVRVTFAVTGGGTITGAIAFTDANGVATVGSWTLGPTAGEQTLTATAGSLAAVTFVATAQAGTAESLAKSAGDEQIGSVATALPVAPAVVVRDLLDNPVAGATVVFEVATGGGSITAATAVTNNLGIAAVGSWTLGTTAGTNTLTATVGSLSTTFTATGTAAAPSNIVKHAGDGQTATAGTAVTTAPAVRITDAHSNPVEGVTVAFAAASGGGSVTGASQTTDSDGIATIGSWTLGTTPGENELTATAGSLSATFTATAEVGPPANIVEHEGDGQSATVNTAVGTAPTVLVTDSFGNPVPGISVTFAASGDGSVTDAVQVTDASGLATVGSWTLDSLAGANTLTATAGSLVATFTATGTADAPDDILIVAGDDQDAEVDTDVAIPPSVRVIDKFGNNVEGVTVTFTVTLGGGSVTDPVQVTGSNGVATVGGWTLGPAPGDNELTATAGSVFTVFSATGTTP